MKIKKYFILLLALSFAITGFTQLRIVNSNNNQTAERENAAISIPALNVKNVKDGSVFTNLNLEKESPIVMMMFSSSCDHCKEVVAEITQNIERFKGVQIVMVSSRPMQEIKEFYKEYNLKNYPQIVVTKAENDWLFQQYKVRVFPMLIVYNEKHEYINTFDRNFTVESVWKVFEN